MSKGEGIELPSSSSRKMIRVSEETSVVKASESRQGSSNIPLTLEIVKDTKSRTILYDFMDHVKRKEMDLMDFYRLKDAEHLHRLSRVVIRLR